VWDVALGETVGREPLDVAHLHSGFCVTKPLLGLAVGVLIDRGLVSLADRVDRIEIPQVPTGTTVAMLLNHSAGMVLPTAAVWRCAPRDERRALLGAPANGHANGYSELASGLVLEQLIRSAAGIDPAQFVTSEILVPLDATDIVLHPSIARRDDVRPRIRVPFFGDPDGPVPLLSESLPVQLADIRPAFGGLVSARALGRLMRAVGKVLRGKLVEGLPSPRTLASMLECRRGVTYDTLLRRSCDFAGGFMVGLEHHGLEGLSERAVGHTGGLATALAFADPVSGIAAAMYLNCLLADADMSRNPCSELTASIVQDLTGTHWRHT
jgi:CubicO group peptidase (beta-lactamase class C family)